MEKLEDRKLIFKDFIDEETHKGNARAMRSWGFADKISGIGREIDEKFVELVGCFKQLEKFLNDDEIVKPNIVSELKYSMEKLAFSIDDFVEEFKPTFEKVINRHTIDTVAGDNEDKNYHVVSSSTMIGGSLTISGSARVRKPSKIAANRMKSLRKTNRKKTRKRNSR